MYSSLVHYDRIDSVPILRIQKRNLSSPLHVLQVYHCISLSCDKDLDYQHTETVGLWIMGPSNLSLESYLEYQHLYYIIWIDTNSIDICCSIGYIVHTHTPRICFYLYTCQTWSNIVSSLPALRPIPRASAPWLIQRFVLGAFNEIPKKTTDP